jgi:multidrug resistance efflux pump
MKRGLSLAVALLVVVAVGSWRWRIVTAGNRAGQASVPTTEITRQSLVVTLPVNGALESAQDIPVRSEIAGSLLDICPDNSLVKPGDFAFQLDTKDLTDERERLTRAVTDAEEALNTEQSDSETRTTQAQSEAEAAREALKLAQEKAQAEREKMAAQVKFAEGEMERATREYKRSQRLAELNYIAGTKLRQAEKAYRQQEFGLAQQRAQQADVEKRTQEQIDEAQAALDLALHGLEAAKADALVHLEDGRIDLAEAKRKLAEVDKKVAQSTLTCPAAGMAVIQTNSDNWPERRPYRLGDRVESGAAPVRIYDFRRMQVRCQIGEIDISRVHQGQDVYVSSPTLPEKRYRGKVASVEQLAQESNVWQGGTPGKKVFGVLVTLSEADPARLRPGMTVDLEIVLARVPEAVVAPIRAVFSENGRRFAYRARARDFERVPVTIGARNDLLVEVRGALTVGDRVALELPPALSVGRAEVRK